MARRTGLYTMQQVAKRLCGLINDFTPIITQLFGSNAALLAALAAANAACAVLVQEIEGELVYGD